MERWNFERIPQAVDDWRRVLDKMQQLPEIGDKGPVGYWGVSMGTRFGLPTVASDPRISCAVLGLFGLKDNPDPATVAAQAAQITQPLNCTSASCKDEYIHLDGAVALFHTYGSKEKTMHLNPGRHAEIPAFENDAVEAFFMRHLGVPRVLDGVGQQILERRLQVVRCRSAEALRGVSPAERFRTANSRSLVGPSGCGKSTLLAQGWWPAAWRPRPRARS